MTCIDAQTWLADATGDDALDDDRTLAQVVVGQVDFADALVLRGSDGLDGWQRSRLNAVLARIAPRVPVFDEGDDIEALLEVPADARRGELADAHSPLLRRQPPLDDDGGVMLVEFTANRPFHPGVCTRRSTSCSKASCTPAGESGWRRNLAKRSGSNRRAAACELPARTPGWPR